MKTAIKNLFEQKGFKGVAYVIIAVLVIAVVFQAGMLAGYHKAGFSRDWGDKYESNFGMPRPDSMRGMMFGQYPTAHGAGGKILTISLPTFSIEDRDGIEKRIVVSSSTIIKEINGDKDLDTLKVGDNVIILGEPNTDGQIEAKFIRVFKNNENASTTPGYGHMGWSFGW